MGSQTEFPLQTLLRTLVQIGLGVLASKVPALAELATPEIVTAVVALSLTALMTVPGVDRFLHPVGLGAIPRHAAR